MLDVGFTILVFQKFVEILKIGHFKMSIFEKAGGLLIFTFFCPLSPVGSYNICEHYAVITEFVIH
jgi:hypothetical protein